MRITIFIAGIVAATLVGTAYAQSDGGDRTLPESPFLPKPKPESDAERDEGAPESDGDEATPPEVVEELPPTPTDQEARAAHLDDLFRRLAQADEKGWQRIQAQILGAWNQSGSPSMDLLAARADKAVEKKDYDGALLHLNDLVRLAPEFAEGWNKRATVHFLKEDYGKSLEDISRTLKIEPRHFGALAGLGIILDRIGDPKAALEAYRRALSIHPNLPGIKEGVKKLEKQVEGERL